MTNYSENLFQSVDTLVKESLKEVSFDRTIIGEIVQVYENEPNKYSVKSDTLIFTAYSQGEQKFSKGNQVYVLVPNGDYSLNKVILGSYSASMSEQEKIRYIEPFSNYLIDYKKDIDINKENNPIQNFGYEKPIKYDYIGLEFSLDTTNLKDTPSPYTLTIKISPPEEEEEKIIKKVINSSELFGNPYNLTEIFKFQKLFEWPTNLINTDMNNYNVTIETSDTKVVIKTATLSFGYDKSKIEPNKLILSLGKGESIEYDSEGNLNRNLYLDWYLKEDEELKSYNYYHIPSNENQSEYTEENQLEYTIYYLQYQLGHKKKLENENGLDIIESGPLWKTVSKKTIPSDKLEDLFLWGDEDEDESDLTLNSKANTTNFKVGIKDNNGNYIESNVIIFTNTDLVSDPGTIQNTEDSIKLITDHENKDFGTYNYYGLDDRIVDSSYAFRERTITASFLDGREFIEEANGKKSKDIENVIWTFPTGNTMIETILPYQDIKITKNNNYYSQYEIQDTDKNVNNWNVFKYKIKNHYNLNYTNNTIYCDVKFDTGETRHGRITLQFGNISTSGSEYSLNIDFMDNKNCVYINDEGTKVKATFERFDGQPIGIDYTIKWSWYNDVKPKNLMIDGAIEGKLITKTIPHEIKILYEGDMPQVNTAVLQATVEKYTIDNGLETDLTAYLPIPISSLNEYSYVVGTTQIVYNSNGNEATYSKEPYQLFNNEGKVVNDLQVKMIKSKIQEAEIAEIKANAYFSDEDESPLPIIFENITNFDKGFNIPEPEYTGDESIDEKKHQEWLNEYPYIELQCRGLGKNKNEEIMICFQYTEDFPNNSGKVEVIDDSNLFMSSLITCINKIEYVYGKITINYTTKSGEIKTIELNRDESKEYSKKTRWTKINSKSSQFDLSNNNSEIVTYNYNDEDGYIVLKEKSSETYITLQFTENDLEKIKKLFDEEGNFRDKWDVKLYHQTENNIIYYKALINAEIQKEEIIDNEEIREQENLIREKTYIENDVSKIHYYCVPFSYIPDKKTYSIIFIDKSQQILWAQPIFIFQNRWEYSLTNQWNGALETGENYILSPLLGAGKKEEDNSFSGVLMGDLRIAKDAENNPGQKEQTGLYGFKNGSASFYFNDNGEAYIGNRTNEGHYYFHLKDDGELSVKVKNFDLKTPTLKITSEFNENEGITPSITIFDKNENQRIKLGQLYTNQEEYGINFYEGSSWMFPISKNDIDEAIKANNELSYDKKLSDEEVRRNLASLYFKTEQDIFDATSSQTNLYLNCQFSREDQNPYSYMVPNIKDEGDLYKRFKANYKDYIQIGKFISNDEKNELLYGIKLSHKFNGLIEKNQMILKHLKDNHSSTLQDQLGENNWKEYEESKTKQYEIGEYWFKKQKSSTQIDIYQNMINFGYVSAEYLWGLSENERISEASRYCYGKSKYYGPIDFDNDGEYDNYDQLKAELKMMLYDNLDEETLLDYLLLINMGKNYTDTTITNEEKNEKKEKIFNSIVSKYNYQIDYDLFIGQKAQIDYDEEVFTLGNYYPGIYSTADYFKILSTNNTKDYTFLYIGAENTNNENKGAYMWFSAPGGTTSDNIYTNSRIRICADGYRNNIARNGRDGEITLEAGKIILDGDVSIYPSNATTQLNALHKENNSINVPISGIWLHRNNSGKWMIRLGAKITVTDEKPGTLYFFYTSPQLMQISEPD